MRYLKWQSLKNDGQLLIELIVALGVLTTGFLGAFGLLSRAIGLNRLITDNYTASYLAAEGVEVVKNIIDSNITRSRPWNQTIADGLFEVDYLSYSASVWPVANAVNLRKLLFDPATQRYGYRVGSDSAFRRGIELRRFGNYSIRIISTVYWSNRGRNYSFVVEDYFYDWRP